MDRTTIQCPSCDRKISVALSPLLTEISLTKSDFPLYEESKEHTLFDILYVCNELVRENNRLKDQIETYKMLLGK